MAQPENDGEFVIPSETEVAARIRQTGGIEWWPGMDSNGNAGEQRTEPVNLEGTTPKAQERFVEGRILRGPGPKANAFQREHHAMLKEQRELAAEAASIREELTKARGKDPFTGSILTLAADSPERQQLEARLRAIKTKTAELAGEYGKGRLKRALERAVAEEMATYQDAEIEHEAQRRLQDEEREARIQARIDALRPAGKVKATRHK